MDHNTPFAHADSTSHSAEKNAGAGANPLAAIAKQSGGGAIKGIGETFSVSGPTGTATAVIPVPTSPARSGFGPTLSLSYDSGTGNSTFGLGWQLGLPSITRKTDKGLPRYIDDEESDVYVMSGVEDLVPVLDLDEDNNWVKRPAQKRQVGACVYNITTYRPRVEGGFSRIERWADNAADIVHWRAITKENVTSIFGDSDMSRIHDPVRPSRVFSWLLSRSYDDKGSLIRYDYKPEDSEGVDLSQPYERLRSPHSRSVARYLKRIRYSNTKPHHTVEDHNCLEFLFEAVLDYGEHDLANPTPRECRPWKTRKDPFSSHRSTFEIRTYRTCQRILMFHHFPDEPDVGKDCLVAATELTYDSSRTVTLLTSAVQRGYMTGKGHLSSQTLPPVEFDYSRPSLAHNASALQPRALENVPVGADGTDYQFIDLDAEGLPGLLSQQAGEWFYKPNLGNGRFGPIEALPLRPESSETGISKAQWLDLTGDGRLDLVRLRDPTPGFFRRDWTADGGWENYQHLLSLPNIDWSNAHFADLTGDGLADAFLTDDNFFTMYTSAGEEGFEGPTFWRPPVDEDRGPRLLLQNSFENVYLADMSGDGLVDLVRIRNGEVCYWPNLGYGRFGSKVNMTNAPFFDKPDIFAHYRIQLADIDGTGATDLVIMHGDNPLVYLNESGNSWAKPYAIKNCPPYDDTKYIQVVDLLGRGTGCLVFSSKMPLDDNTGRQMLYMDLMTEGKPYLLKSIKNNFGGEIFIDYTSSTQFYIQDKLAGNPWLTRLPFPVQVVSKVTSLDRVSGNEFVSKYAYHHGFFDPYEREYRGFGMVEKQDTDFFRAFENSSERALPTNANLAFTSPPVLTKTWYDTGAYLRGSHIAQQLDGEFYHGSDSCKSIRLSHTFTPTSIRLADKDLPYTLTVADTREAIRSLRGSTLRQEVYGLDDSPYEHVPYMVKQGNYKIELLQPRGANPHAVFFTRALESLQIAYERNKSLGSTRLVEDPRISHGMIFETDIFGNPLTSLTIAYGRLSGEPNPLLTDEDREKQMKLQAMLHVSQYTNVVSEADAYRTPVPCESMVFEVINFPEPHCKNENGRSRQSAVDRRRSHGSGEHHNQKIIGFGTAALLMKRLQAKPVDVPFEDFEATSVPPGVLARRLTIRSRVILRRNDLSGPLPFGQLESLALSYKSYTQALTPGLVKRVFLDNGKLKSSSYSDILRDTGGYVQLEGDPNYWVPSGQVLFSPASKASFAEEKTYATHHFYLPHRYRDPMFKSSFRTEAEVRFDKYDLLPIENRDAMGNCNSVGERGPNEGFGTLSSPKYDYRVLRALIVMDANRNRNAFSYDALGLPCTSAVQGKPEEKLGDELSGFPPILDERAIVSYFADPLENGKSVLGNATTRSIYDLHAYYRTRQSPQPLPSTAATIQRETHLSDLNQGQESRLQISVIYQDGLGRICQSKAFAGFDHETKVQRWLTSGWTIYNNKGSPVQRFEPLYTSSHHYQREAKEGVSSIYLLDPLQRTVSILNPNHTWSKSVVTPWAGQSWDANDTSMIDPTQDIDVQGYYSQLPTSSYSPSWYDSRKDGKLGASETDAARKTAVHAHTPTNNYLDSTGRTIVTIAHNKSRRSNGKSDSIYFIGRVDFDATGNVRRSTDQLGRTMETKDYDMLQQALQSSSMDAGTSWMLRSCIGKPVYHWTSRGFELSTLYDVSQRPLRVHLRHKPEEASLISEMVYGDSVPNSEKINARGRAVISKDQSGITKSEVYDFKGNLLSKTQQVTSEAVPVIDWAGNQQPQLQTEIYRTSTTYDAVNRSITVSEPDGSVIKHYYNRAGQIQRVVVELPYKKTSQVILSDAQYNARGQRMQTLLGNGIQTTNFYDPLTFRLTRLLTLRKNTHTAGPKHTDRLQDLRYTSDPIGNVTFMSDEAKKTVFFGGEKVDPTSSYNYDSVYRLIEATGREHLGQSEEARFSQIPSGHHRNDGNAMGTYHESYFYDPVGNILEMRHARNNHSHGSWAKRYSYKEPSRLEPQFHNNRLTSTRVGNVESFYKYEGNEGSTGNITSMAGVSLMRWNFRDQLHAVSSQRSDITPQTTWYTYDDSGQRVRKVAYLSAPADKTPTRKTERLYLGDTEVYREYAANSDSVTLERWTLHLSVGGERIAMNETLTKGTSPGPIFLTRFQHINALGSAVIELDMEARILSYEEYYPYGETSYFASNSTPKRYRYSGKERDEESGFYYYGKRYYVPWIGRWISADPGGLAGGPNLYQFTSSNPISLSDPDGGIQVILTPGGMPPLPPPGAAVPQWPSGGGFNFEGFKAGAEALKNNAVASGEAGAASTETAVVSAETMATGTETAAIATEVTEVTTAAAEILPAAAETTVALVETTAVTDVGLATIVPFLASNPIGWGIAAGILLIAAGAVIYHYAKKDDKPPAQPGQQNQADQSTQSQEGPNQSISVPGPEGQVPIEEGPGISYTPANEPNSSEMPPSYDTPGLPGCDDVVGDQPTEGPAMEAAKDKEGREYRWHRHHILPQRFDKDKWGNFFTKLGIDINKAEFIRMLHEWEHEMIHHLKDYDAEWDRQVTFWLSQIAAGVKVTAEEVIAWARELQGKYENLYGIGGPGRDSKEDFTPKKKPENKPKKKKP
ncbi:hypothetical protein GP486_000586 [Trichoglossum hirsutum]|uniref:SpvB-domain-containing protein n=1 Tax=Trichoglossum hirsutum TaxID=265104 RepID=A0A9P8LIR0_9PEZI|nr:hypothetical protein GP486_000586 [Trichoglossum hirsutum]